MVIPAFPKIMQGLVDLAQGKKPEGNSGMRVMAGDMLAAIRPLDDVTGAEKSELEHLETYQPKQLLVVQGDFIYRGRAVPGWGSLSRLRGRLWKWRGRIGRRLANARQSAALSQLQGKSGLAPFNQACGVGSIGIEGDSFRKRNVLK